MNYRPDGLNGGLGVYVGGRVKILIGEWLIGGSLWASG